MGGGSDLKKGLNLIKEDWENNLEYKLISLEEIEDEALFASPYFCGSIGEEGDKGNYSKYTKIKKSPAVVAVQALKDIFKKN